MPTVWTLVNNVSPTFTPWSAPLQAETYIIQAMNVTYINLYNSVKGITIINMTGV